MLYGSVLTSSNDQSLIFEYVPTTDTVSPYFTFGGDVFARAFTHLYDSNIFVLSYPTANDYILMARVDFSNLTSYSWYRNMSCNAVGT